MHADLLTFGVWLQCRRKALHLTQQQLGTLARCSTETIRKIETDQRRPSAAIARLLAVALHFPEAEHDVFVRFARGERLGPPALPAAATSGPPTTAVSWNVPAPLAPLIGRDAEVAMLRALLLREETRLVTLTGPGGVGKTRIAQAVAMALRDALSDGVLVVDLEPIVEPSLVLSTIAIALEVRERPGESLSHLVRTRLRDRQMLLVLDNFEQVLGAGLLVVDLLRAVPRLTVLVTSRVSLHLRGEHEVAILPLACPGADARDLATLADNHAVRLFIERARAARDDFQLTDANAPAVAEICARLDGLPLAIELAAARIKVLSPEIVLARLQRRLRLLTGGPRDLPARQQTIRATIDWSYDLLAPVEQRLFARLAVFVGGWTLPAAEAVAAGGEQLAAALPHASQVLPIDVLDTLEALVSKSLVAVRAGDEPRFTMLETIREYALERLQESGEEPAMRSRHASYCLQLAEAAEPELRGQRQRFWLERLEAEHDNLRAALAWCQAAGERQAIGLRLVAALRWFWFLCGYLSEGRRWVAAMLDIDAGSAEASATPHARDRARALGSAALLAWQQGEYQAARAQREEAVAIWRSLADTAGLAEELHMLGHLALDQRDLTAARDAFQESLALYRRLDSHFLIHALTGDLGLVAYHLGDNATAARLLEASAAGLRTHGPSDTLGDLLNRLGDLARLADDHGRAAQLYGESLALFRELGGNLGIASALHKLGYVAQHERDYQRAHELFAESLGLQRGMGNRQGIAECLVGLAGLAVAREVHVTEGRRAARLLAAATGVLKVFDVPLAPADQADFDRAHAAARCQSDETAWTAAWAEGEAMSLEEAIMEALNETVRP